MKILVIGYGRAGKRHARALADRGHAIETVDPYGTARYAIASQAVRWWKPDAVVIASPPSCHIQHIKDVRVFSDTIPILCEKPLCDLGQVDQTKELPAQNLMFAFNYRWHSGLNDPATPQTRNQQKVDWFLQSYQYREVMPSWGLLVDHLPHDIDTLLWMTKANGILVQRVQVVNSSVAYGYVISGRIGEETFLIENRVYTEPVARTVLLFTKLGYWDITPDVNMFDAMYDHFFNAINGNCEFKPGLAQARKVQSIVESINCHAIG